MNNNLLDQFDRVFVINLPDRTDRKQEVLEEFERIGVRVDGERVRFIEAIRPTDAGQFPSKGARGCFLSHLKALRTAQDEGASQVLILEDDVMFDRRIQDVGTLVHTLSHQKWDIVYPGHTLDAQLGDMHWVLNNQPLVCAHCYGVRGDAIDRVIEYLEACMRRAPGHPEGGPMHVDGALSMFRMLHLDVRTLICSQSLAGQRSSRSDIAGPSWLDQKLGARTVRFIRSLRNWMRRVANA